MTTAHIEIKLDIPDVRILQTEADPQGNIFITVESTIEGTVCHKCGHHILIPHGRDREIMLRHLSILGRDTYIRIRPKRYRCLLCEGEPITTQSLEWYYPRSPQTKAYEAHILLQLVNSTVSDVTRKERLGYETVMGIIDRYIAAAVDWSSFQSLGTIGLDEIALKKGHKDFITIVSSRSPTGDIRILAVLKDRKKSTVSNFLLSIPKRLRKTIRTVSSDLYSGFINGAKEALGRKVRIVVDRFQVAKLYRKGVDTLRKKEMRRLKKELSKEAYQELKGVMWLLRKRDNQLTAEEQRKLNLLFEYSPALGAAYMASALLTRIFDEPISAAEGRLKREAWKELIQESTLSCFDTFISTLDAHRDEIANYFIERQNSGFVEGLNNKIKVIKRRCYGILNINRLFQRIFIDTEGYAAFA
jgi:transposase